MTQRWTRRALQPVLALGLAAIPWAVPAQPAADALQDWRQANETVGQFPRGHADVLRWESAQPAAASAQAPTPPAFALPTAAEAVRAAWAAHRELAHPMAQAGPQALAHIAAGHWGMVDPALQRRVHGMDKLLALAAHTRKAWLTAVAARETVVHLETALSAAQAAAELGQRMVRVGNWGRHQQAPIALAESSARLDVQRARLAALQAEAALLQAMGLASVHERVGVPERLPDALATPLAADDLGQRLTALQRHLPPAESRQASALARQAYAAYTASLDAHRTHREEVLRQREVMSDETLLRYNGMLDSTWRLLAEASARSQAVVAAIDAQRTALIAETDLFWVLQGGQPTAFVGLGGGGSGSPAGPGH